MEPLSTKDFTKPPVVFTAVVLVLLSAYFIFVKNPAVKNLEDSTGTTSGTQTSTKTTKIVADTPSVAVIVPNGGDILRGGELYTIQWESKNLSSRANIRITYISEKSLRENKDTGTLIANTINTGRIPWQIPPRVNGNDVPLPYPQCTQGKDITAEFRLIVSTLDANGRELSSDMSDKPFLITGSCALVPE